MKDKKNWISPNDKDKHLSIIRADINRTQKHIRYCDLIIAACVGASVALMGVIAHMMITGPAWTW